MAPQEDKPSSDFEKAIASYWEAKDRYDKIKMQSWHNIPEEPPNKLPKKPREKPWWDKEQEEGWAKMGLQVDAEDGVNDLTSLLSGHELDGKTKEGLGKGAHPKEKKGKQDKLVGTEAKDEEEEEIDVDRLIAMWTGKEGLIVPPGLTFGKL
ncbi:MAG: hypothetical protein Q9217_005770 [Psora testacea]